MKGPEDAQALVFPRCGSGDVVSTSLAYDDFRNPATVVRQDGVTVSTSREYDGRRRPVMETTDIGSAAQYTVLYGYEAAGRLDSVVTYGGGLTEDLGVRVGYDGVRVSELSGYFEDPSSGLHDDVLRVARAYDGYMETARTIERFVDVSSAPGAGSFEPWRVDATVLDGFGRPEAKVWQLSSAASVPSAIGRQDLYWGRDSKLVGSVKDSIQRSKRGAWAAWKTWGRSASRRTTARAGCRGCARPRPAPRPTSRRGAAGSTTAPTSRPCKTPRLMRRLRRPAWGAGVRSSATAWARWRPNAWMGSRSGVGPATRTVRGCHLWCCPTARCPR